MVWLVDSDQFPVWLKPVSEADASEWIEKGKAHASLPSRSFNLVWASRHAMPSRWYLFPAEAI